MPSEPLYNLPLLSQQQSMGTRGRPYSQPPLSPQHPSTNSFDLNDQAALQRLHTAREPDKTHGLTLYHHAATVPEMGHGVDDSSMHSFHFQSSGQHQDAAPFSERMTSSLATRPRHQQASLAMARHMPLQNTPPISPKQRGESLQRRSSTSPAQESQNVAGSSPQPHNNHSPATPGLAEAPLARREVPIDALINPPSPKSQNDALQDLADGSSITVQPAEQVYHPHESLRDVPSQEQLLDHVLMLHNKLNRVLVTVDRISLTTELNKTAWYKVKDQFAMCEARQSERMAAVQALTHDVKNLVEFVACSTKQNSEAIEVIAREARRNSAATAIASSPQSSRGHQTAGFAVGHRSAINNKLQEDTTNMCRRGSNVTGHDSDLLNSNAREDKTALSSTTEAPGADTDSPLSTDISDSGTEFECPSYRSSTSASRSETPAPKNPSTKRRALAPKGQDKHKRTKTSPVRAKRSR